MEPRTSRIHTKDLYISSSIEIIKKEGYENITVRKLSELTGFTFPTLYHHFSDLGELMVATKNKMIDDMIPTLSGKINHGLKGLDGLKESLKVYASYFIDNPNVFKFFYYYPFPKASEDNASVYKAPEFDNIWLDSFKDLIADGTVKTEEISTLAKIIIFSIHGMITLMFSNNTDINERNILDEINRIIDYLINKN